MRACVCVCQRRRERGFEGFGRTPLSDQDFLKKVASCLSSLNNLLHRSNAVENPRPQVILIIFPVKISATKIMYAVGLLHATTRDAQQNFMRCKLICLRGLTANYVVNIT